VEQLASVIIEMEISKSLLFMAIWFYTVLKCEVTDFELLQLLDLLVQNVCHVAA